MEKNIVYINGNRNGYDEEQCGYTMTVSELIEYLEQFDEDARVYLRNDNGYTYGSIGYEDFSTPDDYPDREYD